METCLRVVRDVLLHDSSPRQRHPPAVILSEAETLFRSFRESGITHRVLQGGTVLVVWSSYEEAKDFHRALRMLQRAVDVLSCHGVLSLSPSCRAMDETNGQLLQAGGGGRGASVFPDVFLDTLANDACCLTRHGHCATVLEVPKTKGFALTLGREAKGTYLEHLGDAVQCALRRATTVRTSASASTAQEDTRPLIELMVTEEELCLFVPTAALLERIRSSRKRNKDLAKDSDNAAANINPCGWASTLYPNPALQCSVTLSRRVDRLVEELHLLNEKTPAALTHRTPLFIGSMMHHYGVRVRELGRVRSHYLSFLAATSLPNTNALMAIGTEMVARTLKYLVLEMSRRKPKPSSEAAAAAAAADHVRSAPSNEEEEGTRGGEEGKETLALAEEVRGAEGANGRLLPEGGESVSPLSHAAALAPPSAKKAPMHIADIVNNLLTRLLSDQLFVRDILTPAIDRRFPPEGFGLAAVATNAEDHSLFGAQGIDFARLSLSSILTYLRHALGLELSKESKQFSSASIVDVRWGTHGWWPNERVLIAPSSVSHLLCAEEGECEAQGQGDAPPPAAMPQSVWDHTLEEDFLRPVLPQASNPNPWSSFYTQNKQFMYRTADKSPFPSPYELEEVNRDTENHEEHPVSLFLARQQDNSTSSTEDQSKKHRNSLLVLVRLSLTMDVNRSQRLRHSLSIVDQIEMVNGSGGRVSYWDQFINAMVQSVKLILHYRLAPPPAAPTPLRSASVGTESPYPHNDVAVSPQLLSANELNLLPTAIAVQRTPGGHNLDAADKMLLLRSPGAGVAPAVDPSLLQPLSLDTAIHLFQMLWKWWAPLFVTGATRVLELEDPVFFYSEDPETLPAGDSETALSNMMFFRWSAYTECFIIAKFHRVAVALSEAAESRFLEVLRTSLPVTSRSELYDTEQRQMETQKIERAIHTLHQAELLLSETATQAIRLGQWTLRTVPAVALEQRGKVKGADAASLARKQSKQQMGLSQSKRGSLGATLNRSNGGGGGGVAGGQVSGEGTLISMNKDVSNLTAGAVEQGGGGGDASILDVTKPFLKEMRPFLNMRCCFRAAVVMWLARDVVLTAGSHQCRSRVNAALFAAWKDRVTLSVASPHYARLDAVLHSAVETSTAAATADKVPFPSRQHRCDGLCCVWKPSPVAAASESSPSGVSTTSSDHEQRGGPPLRSVGCDVLLWAVTSLLLVPCYSDRSPLSPSEPIGTTTGASEAPEGLYEVPARDAEGLSGRLRVVVERQARPNHEEAAGSETALLTTTDKERLLCDAVQYLVVRGFGVGDKYRRRYHEAVDGAGSAVALKHLPFHLNHVIGPAAVDAACALLLAFVQASQPQQSSPQATTLKQAALLHGVGLVGAALMAPVILRQQRLLPSLNEQMKSLEAVLDCANSSPAVAAPITKQQQQSSSAAEIEHRNDGCCIQYFFEPYSLPMPHPKQLEARLTALRQRVTGAIWEAGITPQHEELLETLLPAAETEVAKVPDTLEDSMVRCEEAMRLIRKALLRFRELSDQARELRVGYRDKEEEKRRKKQKKVDAAGAHAVTPPPPVNTTLTKKQMIQQRQDELEAMVALQPWFRSGGAGVLAVAKDDCAGRMRRRELLVDLLIGWINRRADDSVDFVEVEVVRYPLHRSDRTKRGVRSEILSTILPAAKRRTNDVKILRKTVTHGVEDTATGAIVQDVSKPKKTEGGDESDVVLMFQADNGVVAKRTEKRLQTLKATANTAIATNEQTSLHQSNAAVVVSPTRGQRNSMTDNEIDMATAAVAVHVPGCRLNRASVLRAQKVAPQASRITDELRYQKENEEASRKKEESIQRRRQAEDKKLQLWLERQEEERLYQQMQQEEKEAENEKEIISNEAVSKVDQQQQQHIIASARPSNEALPVVLVEDAATAKQLRSSEAEVAKPVSSSVSPARAYHTTHKLSPFQREVRHAAAVASSYSSQSPPPVAGSRQDDLQLNPLRSESVPLTKMMTSSSSLVDDEPQRPKTATHSTTLALPPPPPIAALPVIVPHPQQPPPPPTMSVHPAAARPLRTNAKSVRDEARSFVGAPSRHDHPKKVVDVVTIHQILEQAEVSLEKKLAALRQKSKFK